MRAIITVSDPSLVTFVGTSSADLNDSAFTYALGLGAAWPYDNYNVYANITPLAANDLPADAPSEAVWYKVTNSPNLRDWTELEAVTLVDTRAHAAGAYLQASLNIDFNDPAFDPVIAGVQASLTTTDQTTLAAVTVLLAKIQTIIAPDNAAAITDSASVMPASQALKSGKGVCQQYAAVFVAMARRIGIPARVIVGDLLATAASGTPTAGSHAWVEVQVGSVWLPIEPQSTDYKAVNQSYIPFMTDPYYELPENAQAAALALINASFASTPIPTIVKLAD